MNPNPWAGGYLTRIKTRANFDIWDTGDFLNEVAFTYAI